MAGKWLSFVKFLLSYNQQPHSHGLTRIHPQKPTRTAWVQYCLMYSGRLWPTQTNMQPLTGARKIVPFWTGLDRGVVQGSRTYELPFVRTPNLICEKDSRRINKITPDPFQMMRAKAFWAAQNVRCCFCDPIQGSMSVWGR